MSNPAKRGGFRGMAYQHHAFVAWAASVLLKRRIAGDVAYVLAQNHAWAAHRGERPYFTVTNVSKRRGKLHRNASREVLLELAAQPGSPLLILPYDDKEHVWKFRIYWAGLAKIKPMKAIRPPHQGESIGKFEAHKREYFRRRENSIESERLRCRIELLEALRRSSEPAWAEAVPAADVNLATLIRRIQAVRQAQGIRVDLSAGERRTLELTPLT